MALTVIMDGAGKEYDPGIAGIFVQMKKLPKDNPNKGDNDYE
jgi:hypothetical protein